MGKKVEVGLVAVVCLSVVLVSAFVEVEGNNHGSTKSKGIGIYVLKKGEVTAQFTNYGATLLSLVVPDIHGKLDDVVLGYSNLESYKNDTTYFGGLVGRVANRIGGAKFALDGHVYKLSKNDGNNTLHGGLKGFSKVVWDVDSYDTASHVTFKYSSPDGDQGFPGKLDVSVTYELIGKNKLGVKLVAKPHDKATPVNLAQHTYWNLGGHDSGSILDHEIQIFASKITPVDDQLIPTGEIKDIRGTAFDFLAPRLIGSHISDTPIHGYDYNYVIDNDAPKGKHHLRKVVAVHDSKSGRKLELWSNQPGLQFYTGNMIKDEARGKDGAVYKKYGGLCLETQGFPDSVNHPNFPSQIVKPGSIYRSVMVYRFTSVE
ncbi:hypothetical protein MLD38_031944 [Melastoma candidum]|uniref:Uncharacterized protein n=1 Tax=Melastoma candidum TaxID=119954 RepID=A0ACB9MR93_9MYRT|nr:hypothetical protein MLD38_031944 [Melastoma candidum]